MYLWPRDLFNFGEITDNISKTVYKIATVTMEDQ